MGLQTLWEPRALHPLNERQSPHLNSPVHLFIDYIKSLQVDLGIAQTLLMHFYKEPSLSASP